MKESNPQVPVSEFLDFFPVVELPVTITADLHHTFSQRNEPFPRTVIDQYLVPLEYGEVDELTEFVPCFRLPNTFNMHAIVYWKASLMQYEYVLVSISEQGTVIDKKVIAGTSTDGDSLTTSVTTIEDDFEILILSGHTQEDDFAKFTGANSKAARFELLPEGQIVSLDQ
jgi:hypothetical protein